MGMSHTVRTHEDIPLSKDTAGLKHQKFPVLQEENKKKTAITSNMHDDIDCREPSPPFEAAPLRTTVDPCISVDATDDVHMASPLPIFSTVPA